ncbi:MAG: flagellar basal body-associated FliL family protein [Nocardioides sp.]|nr:flagellar basal body-associated FliL family protein [Nocardioides sp.]
MTTLTTETTTTAKAETTTDKAPRSKKKLLVVAVVLLVALGAAYQFLLRGGPTEPQPGEVLVLEPIQLNLQGGHYLRLGLALQLTADAHELDGSKALDAAIALLSGRSVDELAATGERTELKESLQEQLHEAYHGDVMEVYFTEFVTQ